MEKVVTITLAPCIDKSTSVDRFIPEKKLKCSYPVYEAGGGGINVSRALKNFGINSLCAFVSGGYTGTLLNQLIHHLNIPYYSIASNANTRENFIVFENQTHLQFRFGMPVNTCPKKEWKKILDVVKESKAKIVVLSGSVHPDIDKDFFRQLYHYVRKKNVKLIVDTAGEALKHVLQEGAYLIKPNQNEFSGLFGNKTLSVPQLITKSKGIIRQGKVQHILISLGEEGALWVSADTCLQFLPPKLKVRSTVGAGDTMVAGIIYQLIKSRSVLEAFQFGVACGSATIINEGMQLGTLTDAGKIYPRIKLVKHS